MLFRSTHPLQPQTPNPRLLTWGNSRDVALEVIHPYGRRPLARLLLAQPQGEEPLLVGLGHEDALAVEAPIPPQRVTLARVWGEELGLGLEPDKPLMPDSLVAA